MRQSDVRPCVQIGNISRDDDWICERIDRGGFVDARILSIGKGAKGQLGVVLCVRTVEDDEWLEDEKAPSNSQASTGCSFIWIAMRVPIGAVILAR